MKAVLEPEANSAVASLPPAAKGGPGPGPFEWGEQSLLALAHLAQGIYNSGQVALAVGASPDKVRRWRKHPEFAAALAEMQQRMLDRFEQAGLQAKQGRVALLSERLDLVQQVVEERAASADPDLCEKYGVRYDPLLDGAPGGRTGIVVHRMRSIGVGANAQIIDEFEMDAALLDTEARLARQLAGELGQWTEKTEQTRVQKLYIGISIEDV